MRPTGHAPQISRAALLAVAAALLLRVGFVVARDRPLVSDEIDYDGLGWTLASTGSYSDMGHPTAYRPIGYPAMVACVYAVAGRRPTAVHLVQAALGAASVLLLYLLAGGARAGLWVAWLWAVFPPAILYTDLLMPEGPFTAGLIGAACLAGVAAGRGRRASCLFGAVLGLLALIKPLALLLLPLLPLGARIERTRLPHVGWIALGMLLAFGPWLARNWIVLGSPTLTTSTGANLLIGNNPDATGGYVNPPPAGIPPDATEVERNRGETRSALSYIRKEPIRFLRNGLLKVAHTAGSEGGMLVWSFHPSPTDPSTRVREKYRSLPLWLHAVVSGPYMLAALLGTLGFFFFPRGMTRGFFLALLFATLATHFMFYGGARYHAHLMPFLTLFAGAWISGRRGESSVRLGRFAALTVGLVWLGLGAVWVAEVLTAVRH
jgi:4-amino-4-deoxy-L-arabinose transferase-like glycosyltransferase